MAQAKETKRRPRDPNPDESSGYIPFSSDPNVASSEVTAQFEKLCNMDDTQFAGLLGSQAISIQDELERIRKYQVGLERSSMIVGERMGGKRARTDVSNYEDYLRTRALEEMQMVGKIPSLQSAGLVVGNRSLSGKAADMPPGAIVGSETLRKWRKRAAEAAGVAVTTKPVTPADKWYIWSYAIPGNLHYIPTGYKLKDAEEKLSAGQRYACAKVPGPSVYRAYQIRPDLFPTYRMQ